MQEDSDSRRTIKVLLADDHTMFRQGLAGVLDGYANMEIVGQTNNDEGAVVGTKYEVLEPTLPGSISYVSENTLALGSSVHKVIAAP
jgi:hypothetical protein